MTYKKNFSHEELQELISWTRAHVDAFPQSLQLNQAIFIPDVKSTAMRYIDLIEEHKDHPTFSGQIYHLFLIRDKLIADGLVRE